MKLGIKLKIQLLLLTVVVTGALYNILGESTIFAAEDVRSELLTNSMNEKLVGITPNSIAIVPDPITGNGRKEYAGTLVGFQQALYELYQNGDGGNYGVYVGANVNVSTLTGEIPPVSPSATNITFSSLKGKVANLVFTSTSADEINMNTTAASSARTLTFGTNIHMGSGAVFRNISYSGTNMYMNGYDLHLGGSSFGDGLSIYGGAYTADVTGSPTIMVDSTGGSNGWYFYGGNATSGTLTGNVSLIINNTSGAVNTVSGGAKAGTIAGNVNLSIKDTKGTITNINGGGIGTTTTAANVEGNVKTLINSETPTTGLRYANYIGGVDYGNISGSVTNTVSGYGGFSGSITFVGGSRFGDIGTTIEALTIKNDVDISKYVNGSTIAQFVGANNGNNSFGETAYTGTIKGNVENRLKSGPVSGNVEIQGIHGLGGYGVPKLDRRMIQGPDYYSSNSDTTIDAYDKLSTEEKIKIVKESAKFQVYGNVETWLLGGRMGGSGAAANGFTKGAGYGGLVIGDSTIHVGTANEDGSLGGEGFVSTRAYTDLSYSSTNNSRGTQAAWDLVAGGGQDANAWQIFKAGDNNTIINNAVIRWTYSGGGSGVYAGKNTVTLNGGILDTLEGNGYMVQRHYGDTEAVINNGQVDWFATPGGWSNVKRIGNGKMTVESGTVNAHIGSSYQESNVFGNSETIIKGGDFSGNARGSANKMFSGGPNNTGNLHGSAALTIDFREYKGGTLKVPSNTRITAGLAYQSSGSLGDSVSDSATLNIYTNPNLEVDSLQGATIYGTVGSAANNKIGSIYMNIDAPGSSIGNLLAWDQSNVTSGGINKNVEVNIQRAKSIGTISGGNANDSFTNAIVENANSLNKKVVFNVGVNLTPTEEGIFQKEPINISGGLINFTELNVDNGTLLNASAGNISNGRTATAGTHGANFSRFGHLNIKNGGGIGVSGTNSLVSVGDVTVTGESKIETRPGTGIINLSSLNFTDDESRFNWIKLSGGAATVLSNGSYWGATQAYQVLTFSPTIGNANVVSPFNFIGIEKDTGKTFIGDNDTTKASFGYGIAIAGSVIDYSVESGVGEMYHDVANVTTSKTPPISGNGWATYSAGPQSPKSQKGRLVIPASKNILPTITSDPDDSEGMWIKKVTATSTKVDSAPEVFPERNDDQVQNWTSLDGDYSYNLEAEFKNDAELSVRSKIISLADVQAMSDYSELASVTEVMGRPFLTSDLTAAKLEALQQSLAADEHRTVDITYSVGYGTNKLTETVKVSVVGVNFKISDDGYYAVHTNNDVSIRQAVLANFISSGTLLEFYASPDYVYGFGFSAESPTTEIPVTPVNGANHLTDLKNSTTFPTSVTQPYGIRYTQDGDEKILARDIDLTVTGNTSIVTVEFHNENNQVMPGYTMTIDEKDDEELLIGQTIDLTNTQFGVTQKLLSLEDAGFEVMARPTNEGALVLDSEAITVVYKMTGLIYLSSAPENIDFGTIGYNAKVKRVDDGSLDGDLVVNDTRATKSQWELGAKLKSQMTNTTNNSAKLVDSLQYVYRDETIILNDGLQRIYQDTGSLEPNLKVTNISDTWGMTKESDGIKLVVDPSISNVLKGTYTGVIEWQFMEATP